MSRPNIIVYKTRNGLKEGLLTQYYTWHGEKPPDDLEALKPIRKSVSPWINYVWWDSPAPGVPSEFFAIMWKGFINIPRTGEYRFYVTTDDGSRLWIDDQLVIDAWSDQPPTTHVSEPVYLEAGYHRIKYYFYNRYAFAEAVLGWIPPVGEPGVIPREYFKHTDTEYVRFTGLPDEYIIELVGNEETRKCIPKTRECMVKIPFNETPYYARLRILDKETGEVIHESPGTIEFWGGDEIKIIIGIIKA